MRVGGGGGGDTHAQIICQFKHSNSGLGTVRTADTISCLADADGDGDATEMGRCSTAALITMSGVGPQCPGWGGGGWHKASVSDWLPLAAPIGLSPLLTLTLCGSERVLVASTEPLDDLSCLTTPGVGCPGDGLLPRAVDQVHPDAHSKSTRGFADSSTDLCALGCASAGGGGGSCEPRPHPLCLKVGC